MKFFGTPHYHIQKLPYSISETVAELRRLLLKMPIRKTLSCLALPTFFGDPETYKESESKTLHTAVEYPSWLYALFPESSLVVSGALNDTEFQSLLTLVNKAINLTIQYYASDLKTNGTLSSFDEIRFMTRLQHLLMRNPAYLHHLGDQLASLFNPFEKELRHLVGFGFEEAMTIFNSIREIENERTREIPRAVKDSEGTVDSLASQIARVFEFNSQDVASKSGLDRNTVEKILDYFSTRFGQTKIANSWPSVYEPLERAPLLKFSDGIWLAHLLEKLPWAIAIGLEAALQGDPITWARYDRNRAQYLESHAVTLIASTSKHAQKWTRLQYVFDDGKGPKLYELDGLVLVDRTAFLVEGKAGRMSGAARRGAESAISELGKLVGEAHAQANRALRYLNSTGECHFQDATGEDVPLRRNDIARVYLVNVTLDSLTAFVTHLAGLRNLGILQSAELTWSVYDLDLQIITDIADGVGELVHYLDRRLALERLNVTASEELDWFGNYISSGLFLDRLFTGPDAHRTLVMLQNNTEKFDAYYAFKMGIRKTPVPKPRQPMSRLLRKLIKTLERNGPAGFIDAICMLLEGGSETRRMTTKQIKDQRARAKQVGFAGFRNHLDNCSVLCYAAVTKVSPKQIVDYVKTAKYQMRSKYAVGIMQNVANPNELQVSVERYPWKEDSSLDELAKTFSKGIHSKSVLTG